MAKRSRKSEKYKLPGGTTRSNEGEIAKAAYHLVPAAGHRRTAIRFGVGAEKHGEGNWKLSLTTEENAKVFARDAFNHMQEHMLKMANGTNPEDDHLGAIGWAQSVLAHIEEVFGMKWTELDTTGDDL